MQFSIESPSTPSINRRAAATARPACLSSYRLDHQSAYRKSMNLSIGASINPSVRPSVRSSIHPSKHRTTNQVGAFHGTSLCPLSCHSKCRDVGRNTKSTMCEIDVFVTFDSDPRTDATRRQRYRNGMIFRRFAFAVLRWCCWIRCGRIIPGVVH